MAQDEWPDYSVENPPKCLECFWHEHFVSPITGQRMYWSDSCRCIGKPFYKMHIVLLGEYRTLSKHDEDDLKMHLPYECPYFDWFKAFWEIAGRKMEVDELVYESSLRPREYSGCYVYSLAENISQVAKRQPLVRFHFYVVNNARIEWFVMTFGEGAVLVSDTPPERYEPPLNPI